MIIRFYDFLECGICMKGMRQWHKDNNYDINIFLKNGYESDFLKTFDNPFINRVIKYKMEQCNGK